MLLCSRARWREAINPLRRAVELDHSHVEAWFQLGEAYNATDRLIEALEAFEIASELRPGNWRALKGIGIVLDRMGKTAEATVMHRRAHEAQHR
jgi:Flp pilus assembly protein TadD